ncbi:MAG: MlaA family lipoprotein, partial [Acidobacteriota bacterium]
VVRRMTNNIFQLKLMGVGREVARFTINSTVGIGGLFDVAKEGFGIDQSDQGEWFLLNWMEKPSKNGPSTLAEPGDRTDFLKGLSFDKNQHDDGSWPAIRQNIQEGDVISYWKEKWEARNNIFLKAQINQVGYRLFKYGHVAIVVRDVRDENTLHLLSSEAFKGPNIREDIDTLKDHSWDVYRLNQWDRVDKKRFYEFVDLVRQKAERWYGYDFRGMFGLWNSNLQPSRPEEIGRSYICSTVILAALHYAGVELDAYQRYGIADIVTPLQIVGSKGRIVPVAEVTIEAYRDEVENNSVTP